MARREGRENASESGVVRVIIAFGFGIDDGFGDFTEKVVVSVGKGPRRKWKKVNVSEGIKRLKRLKTTSCFEE